MTEKTIYDAKLDNSFGKVIIDIDESRHRRLEDGTLVPYRHIHGRFEHHNLKFLFCFPEKEAYQGRFFQYLSPFPGPDEENASLGHDGEDDRIAFALTHGAYYVESNMGSLHQFGGAADPTLCWKASAKAAEYSRIVAMEIYGCGRPYGYVHGGSGGGYKSMACIENTNAFDGAVPYVIGSPVSLPNTITMHAQGQRALRRVFGKIVDALDAGGSGNMYEGLTPDEAFMLRELTAMGFPPQTWFVEATGLINDGSLPLMVLNVKGKDPGYFEDFWTIPGYLGSDPTSSAARDRMKFTAKVTAVHGPGAPLDKSGLNGVDDAWKKQLTDGNGAWIEVDAIPRGDDLYWTGTTITIQSGAAAGLRLTLGQVRGNCLILGPAFGIPDLGAALAKIQPGDVLLCDNSDYIAIQSYYRHQVPENPDFHAWDQFRDADGKAMLPQRANVMGYRLTGTGTIQDGNIQGKTIVVQSLMDESTCPWCAHWYAAEVEKQGKSKDFRLYYMERCMHGNVSWLENNMVTNYLGASNQALLDISDWVERGIEPCASTVYEYEPEGQIVPAATAAERRGIQPTVRLLANGRACAHVKAGEEVLFTVAVQVPEGAGTVTAVDYDLESDMTLSLPKVPLKTFRNALPFKITQQGAASAFTAVYQQPGIHMASVRVKLQRNGNGDPYTQIKNIARVRVVVE